MKEKALKIIFPGKKNTTLKKRQKGTLSFLKNTHWEDCKSDKKTIKY